MRVQGKVGETGAVLGAGDGGVLHTVSVVSIPAERMNLDDLTGPTTGE